MKILFTQRAISKPFIRGLANVLKQIGDEVIICPANQLPIDMFDIAKPAAIFFTDDDININLLFALSQYKNTISILYGIQNKNFTTVIIPPTTPPHVVKNINCNTVLQTQYAADLIDFGKGCYLDKTKSDILIISGENTPSNINSLNQINSLLNTNLVIKCVGYKIPNIIYIGKLDTQTLSCFIQSASIVISYNDSMTYNCWLNKTPCLLFPNDNTIATIKTLIKKQQKQQIKQNFQTVINTHTYFHRLSQLGKLLNIDTWTNALQILPKFIP